MSKEEFNTEIINNRNRDADAFNVMYRQYYESLCLVSLKYVKDLHIAREIVQELFMKIWENPIPHTDPGAIRGYLYRSVINLSLNHLSREKNIQRHHQQIAAMQTEEDVNALHEEQDFKIHLYNAIERLPEQCRRVFRMSRFEGMKYREIAAALNIAEKTVENHIVNALRLLRERMFQKN